MLNFAVPLSEVCINFIELRAMLIQQSRNALPRQYTIFNLGNEYKRRGNAQERNANTPIAERLPDSILGKELSKPSSFS